MTPRQRKPKKSKKLYYSSDPAQRELRPVSNESRAAFHSFLDEVRTRRTELGFAPTDAVAAKWPSDFPRECLYRGHSSSTFVLLPTLIRSAINLGWQPVTRKSSAKARGDSIAKLQDLESQLFYEFLARARKLAPHIEDDWDVLFLMRHHMVATRLLDWTQTLGVALHFALWPIISNPEVREQAIRNPDHPDLPWHGPHVWLLNPYRLNNQPESWSFDDMVAPRFLDEGDESYGDYMGDFSDPGMGWQLPVAVLPEVLNDRLNAQRGVFTIHGDLHAPMEQLLTPDILQRANLPRAALAGAIEFLEDAGLNESVLFPDLDALARDLHRKYRL